VINHPLTLRVVARNTLLVALVFSSLPTLIAIPIDRAYAQVSQGQLAEADRLLKRGKEQLQIGQLDMAVNSLQQALKVFQELNYRTREAEAILSLGLAFEALGNPKKALEALYKSLRIAESLGNRSLKASVMSGLGNAFLAIGDSNMAISFFKRSLAIKRAIHDQQEEGRLLGAMGNAYLLIGLIDQAMRLQKQSLQISEVTRDPRGESIALRSLGKAYEALAQYDNAIDSHEKSLAITKRISDHLGEIESLINRGVAYRSRGDVERAMADHTLGLRLAREFGVRQLEGSALGNIGMNYFALGLYRDAVDYHRQRLEIARQTGDRQGEANAMGNLGNTYRAEGEYAKAIEYLEQRLAITQAIGEKRGEGQALSFLGLTYLSLGNVQRAIEYCQRSLAITEQIGDRQTSTRTLGYLGTAYYEIGNYKKAGQHHSLSLRSARAIHDRRAEGKSLGYLGDTSAAQRKYQEAIQLYEASLSVAREVKDRRGQGRILAALGNIHLIIGSPAKAISYLQQGLAIAEGINNPQGKVTAYHYLAVAFIKAGDLVSAERNLKEGISNWVMLLRSQLPLLPESQRQKLSAMFPDRWQLPFSLALQGEAGAELALFTRLNRHGLLLDIQRNQSLLARSGPQRPLFEKLQSLTAQLADTTVTAANGKQLLEQKEELEQQLYRLLPQIRPQLVQPNAIARLLPAQGLLIEFQRYRPYDARKPAGQEWGPEHYMALLLKPDGSVRAINLGEAAPMDALVAQAMELSERKRLNVDEPLKALSDQLLGPFGKELAGIRQLFVTPDGELNRLPFAALPMPGQPGRLLSEALKLRLLTSGRDLVRLQQSVPSGGPTVLVANPEFTPGAVTPACDPNGSPLVRQPGQWQPLPCTAEEASRLAPLLQVPKPLLGAQASAANVLATHRPRILHIASHGFFWSEEQARQQASRQAAACRPAAGASARAPVSGSSPTSPAALARSGDPTGLSAGVAAPSLSQTLESLQRSGIVLAGANEPCRSAGQDGYLTAAEATGMDLQGTELTTLSACQTGLGDVRSGEGVYGLQRALTVAGSRSTLLTLWKVGDAATQEFMTEFYKRLRRGESRADALAATQATFRNHPNEDYRHVYYWGAFQLTGDWQPIAGW